MNHSKLLRIACVTMAAFTSSLSMAQNLVSNSGFESVSPQPGTNSVCGTYVTNVFPVCAVTAWTGSFLIGQSGGAGNGLTYGIPVPDPDGVNAAILQGTMSASQTFTAMSAGAYTLSFFVAQRATPGYSSIQTLDVQLDSGSVLDKTFTNLPVSWTFQSIPINLITGQHNLTLRGLATVDATVFIDKIAISAVPEPSTWFLLVLGFASIGPCYLRRRSGAA